MNAAATTTECAPCAMSLRTLERARPLAVWILANGQDYSELATVLARNVLAVLGDAPALELDRCVEIRERPTFEGLDPELAVCWKAHLCGRPASVVDAMGRPLCAGCVK